MLIASFSANAQISGRQVEQLSSIVPAQDVPLGRGAFDDLSSILM